jgi:hypothetical protein
MSSAYTEKDILKIADAAKKRKKSSQKSKEGNFTSATELVPFVGSQRDKVAITPGFKIKHRKSGLAYTVQSVDMIGNDIVLTAASGDGEELLIPSKEFKSYERQ